jgi:hypothetical protein
MRRFPPFAAAALAVMLTAAAVPAHALVPADVSMTAGPVSSVVSVSPDVYYDEASSTYFLYTTGSGRGGPPAPGGPSVGVYSSADGESWVEVPGASTPAGPYSDPSVARLPDGTYRMYYAYRSGTGPGQPCSGKQLRYATSTDLIRWTAQSGTLLDDLGCGVPNVVYTGSEYRLYYVRGGEGLAHGTYMATSPDGLAWTPTNTLLTPTDMVDPSVVQISDGSWLMFTADFPAGKSSRPFFQKLYVGTSEDGIEWDFGAEKPLHAGPPNEGAFDPDAVVLPGGGVRIWWSQGTSADTANIVSGDVTVTPSPDPGPEPTPAPQKPAKPTVTVGKVGIKVSWSYPAGAPAPDGYVVQVKTTKAWKAVAEVAATSTSIAWAKVGAKKGRAFSVRVVAFIDESTATSPAATAKRTR